jgi:hypothetical protein
MSATRVRFESERDLALAVVSRLRLAVDVMLSCEAPVLGRSADVALCRADEVHTIEFKLHDWRQALRQAIDHQLAADFAFVCMPERRVTDAMRDAFADTGVGLLFFADAEWPFEIVFEARRSTATWCFAYDRLKSHIHQDQHVG